MSSFLERTWWTHSFLQTFIIYVCSVRSVLCIFYVGGKESVFLSEVFQISAVAIHCLRDVIYMLCMLFQISGFLKEYISNLFGNSLLSYVHHGLVFVTKICVGVGFWSIFRGSIILLIALRVSLCSGIRCRAPHCRHHIGCGSCQSLCDRFCFQLLSAVPVLDRGWPQWGKGCIAVCLLLLHYWILFLVDLEHA